MRTRTLMRIRKWISLIGIVSVLSGLIVLAPVASAYSGADAPSWAKDAVDQACERGLIDCELDDPGFAKPVDRATGYQMLTMGFDVYSETALSPFTDVAGEWWQQAAHTAYTLGWSVGKNGKFMPGDAFTRAQMAVAVNSVLGLDPLTKAEAGTVLAGYPDVKLVPDWALIPMAAMVKEKLIGQGDIKQLRPNEPVKKIETIVIINASVTNVEVNERDIWEAAVLKTGAADVDMLQQALDEGMNIVDGALVAVTPSGEEEEEEEEIPAEEEEEEIPPVVTGTASIAVAGDTPTGTILASGTAFNPVFKLTVSAGSEADVKLTGLTVARSGLSANANVAGVGVYDASDVRHGNIGTSWNDNNTMDIDFTSEPITVAKGTSAPVTLKANLAVGAMSGTLVLTVTKVEDIKSDATLSGTFPLSSQQFDLRDGSNTVAAVTVDNVSVHANGATDATNVSVNLGTTRQHLTTFRFANGAVEAVNLTSLTIYNNGSAADGDVTNITLVGPDGTDLKVVAKTTNKYAVFDGLNYNLAKSASAKDFKVYADVVGGSTRTVRFLIQNDYDLVLQGVSSKANILATAAAAVDTAFPIGDMCAAGTVFCNRITVSAGTLSFSKSPSSPTGNVAAGGTGLTLARIDLKATGEDMEIRQMSYRVGSSSVTALGGTLYFKIREAGTSTTSTTLYSIAGASAVYAPTAVATVTTTFVKLTAGKDYYLEVIGDINSATAANSTFTVGPVDITQVKRMNTNDIVDPGVGTATANTVTVKSGTLTVTANSGATAPQVVAGQATLTTLGTWDFTAGAGEGISLQTVVVGTTTGTQTTQHFGGVKDCELWIDGAKRSTDTSSTITIPTSATTVTFNISPTYTIAASQSGLVELKCKLLSTATAGTVTFRMTASGVTGNGITSQAAVTAPAVSTDGQVVTVSTSGTLAVSRDTVTNVKSSQIVAGTTNVTFGAYKLQTGNIEDVKIKKITVRNLGSNTNGLVSIGVYDGATLVGNLTKASLGSDSSVLGNDARSVTFDYSADPYIITKNSYKVLTVKANTVYGATSAQTVQIVVDSIDAEGVGSAAKIYPTLTTESMAATVTTIAYAAGEVIVASNGAALSSATGTSTWISPVMTALAAGGSSTGASTLATGFSTAGLGLTASRVTKLNPLYFGSTIVSDLVAATGSSYSYAIGDVVAINDANATTTSTLGVVTAAHSAGTTLNGVSLTNTALANGDRVTKLPSGASETTLAVAETTYNVGDIVAYSDVGTPANNGLYVVTNAVNVGATMLGAAAATDIVQLKSGAQVVTGDYIAKMPTATTELVSTAATYAYNLGDVVVVDDDSTPTNNGAYVVRTAVAVGTTLVGDSLGIGVTFTTSDRISKLYPKSQEDNLKVLYPTKLNFAWGTASVTSLTTSSTQNEMARFTLGADAANVNNPDAAVSVTVLNFTNLSTARLTSFSLKDYSNNAAITTTYANTTSFGSTAAGGTMAAIGLQQGETRTFLILADAATNAGSQTAQFKFNAGNQFSTAGNYTSGTTIGSAVWAVTATGQSSATSYWTVLTGDASDTSSTALTSSTTGTDTTAPTISTIVFTEGGAAGSTTSFDAGDQVVITFSEKIDPASISSTLFYGATAVAAGAGTGPSVAQTATAGISATVAGTTSTFTFTGITTVAVGCANATPTAITASTTQLGLSAAGTALTLIPSSVTGGIAGTGADLQCGATDAFLLKAAGTVVSGTIRDNAGNTTAAGASPAPTGGY